MPPTPGGTRGLTNRQKEALIERQAADLARLRGINADLLAALDAVMARAQNVDAEAWEQAVNVIAKARGDQ